MQLLLRGCPPARGSARKKVGLYLIKTKLFEIMKWDLYHVVGESFAVILHISCLPFFHFGGVPPPAENPETPQNPLKTGGTPTFLSWHVKIYKKIQNFFHLIPVGSSKPIFEILLSFFSKNF